MEENNSKKILLSVLAVAILIVAVVGISFAAFSFDNSSKNPANNSIRTGSIMMSYAEPTNGINILNALPTADSVGIAQTGTNNVFSFTVASTVTSALTVPYEINVLEEAIDTETYGQLARNQVKIHLTKNDVEVVAPTLVSALTASAKTTNALVLYETSHVHNAQMSISTNYTMRIWIDEAVLVSSISDKPYQFRLYVNVVSTVPPIS